MINGLWGAAEKIDGLSTMAVDEPLSNSKSEDQRSRSHRSTYGPDEDGIQEDSTVIDSADGWKHVYMRTVYHARACDQPKTVSLWLGAQMAQR